ncbi:MAG TPA: hypothetical protein VD862_02750 [Candidatus Paceibacterota bacterium]|nr:hypothetical protein [Candidatus Paceibacterota bacterium]
MGKKFLAIGAIALLAGLTHLACNGDTSVSPSGVPSHSDNSGTGIALPTNPPSGGGTTGGAGGSQPSGVTFEWTRGKDYFGSGYSCSGPVGSAWKSPIVEVKVTNNTDGDIDMGYKVFGEKDPGCGPTVKGLAGADDIFVLLDGPETLGPGESAVYRWRIDLTKLANACGRVQFGWGFNLATGQFINERDRVVNIGACAPPPPPPPPGCEEVNATITSSYETGENSVCGVVEWSANADSCEVFEDGSSESDSCESGAEFCYERDEEEASHTWNIVAKKGGVTCDPQTTIPVPPLQENPCEDSHLEMECSVDDDSLECDINSSTAGTITAFSEQSFPAGQSTRSWDIPEPVCGREIDVEASNRCQDTADDTLYTDECEEPECDTRVRARVREDGQVEIQWQVQSNVDGGTVTLEIYKNGSLIKTLENQPREGRIVKDLDCEDAGEYTVKVIYENDQYDLHCEAEAEFEIDECPPQECEIQNLPDEGRVCFDNPLGNPTNECGYFGLVPLDKDEPSEVTSTTASMNALLAIVKNGSPHCYNTYPDVEQGDILNTPNEGKNISHVTYCGCPVPD